MRYCLSPPGGAIGSTIAGRVLLRTGPKALLVAGLGMYIVGVTLMAAIEADTPYWPHVFAATVLAVAGNSLTFVAANVTALASAPTDEHSLIGGLVNTGLQIGGGLGLAAISAVATAQTGADTSSAALMAGYQAAFATAIGIAAAGLLVAVLFVRAPSAGESLSHRPR